MNIAFYNGVSGMSAYQKNLDTLSHNMANVNTHGYKQTRTAFSDLVYTNMNVHHNYDPNAAANQPENDITGSAADPATNPAIDPANPDAEAAATDTSAEARKYLTGHGVKAAYLDLIFSQGNLVNTGFPLDYAIAGDGLFAVERADGNLEYTRNGAFDISLEGSKGYVVTADGGYVLDAKGKRIALPYKTGTKTFDLQSLGEKLGVYTFSNPFGLEQTDGSCFVETSISGKATAVKNSSKAGSAKAKLMPMTLEASSVDVASQMVEVMTTQKAFQMNGKIVQTADQFEEIINNLR